MKIGVNALFYIPGEVGGCETYLRETLSRMASLYPDHEFVVFGNNENRAILLEDLKDAKNATLVNLRFNAASRPRRLLKEQLMLPRVAARTGIDVLWSPGNLTPFRTKCPRVTTIHDMQYRRFPEDYTRAQLAVMRYCTEKSLRRSTSLLTVSEFSRREIAELGNVPFDNIAVTPHGVSPAFFEPVPASRLADRVIAIMRHGDPYIICVSNTYPHKRIEDAVAAFGKIIGEFPHRLALIGQPRHGEGAVKEAIAALPDPSRVERISRVEFSDLVALTQGADASVFPSNYEGFGLPVLEAMAAGVPIVACRAAAVPEVGGNAIRYTRERDIDGMASALRSFLSGSAADREAISAAERDRARAFTWDATARLTFDALSRAASTP